ncbi:acyltransferase family protein [Hymenobacter properus]|uniref:Acyltransferase n=1 Tax=Hymenobacter properus TaxID=2791026 RepID=A0A931FKU2_9BACT|nr:acyltransferase [Hymenobacter properus]MBF9143443.1 acyltransferase [Hymenobacter properus]MBR7722256.1 acyltransferase [Microvirga sp. SRT04]
MIVEVSSAQPDSTQLPAPKKIFNFNLESLRGVAAIAVVWGHSTIQNGWIDPNYYPKGVWSFAGPGHLSVLVFFLLSGYVIGIAHKKPLGGEGGKISTYLKKRFLRIYPIYLVSLLLALIASNFFTGTTYSAKIIFSHLIMAQAFLSPTIIAIPTAWSLNYEAIFYLLFIPISFYRLSPTLLMVVSIVLGCLFSLLPQNTYTELLPSYGFGFAFWLAGLSLARYMPKSPSTTDYSLMTGCLLLFLSLGMLDAPLAIMHKIGVLVFGQKISDILNYQGVTFQDFGYLPYCSAIIMAFTDKHSKYFKYALLILSLVPALTFYHYYTESKVRDISFILFPTIFYTSSLCFFFLSNQLAQYSQRFIKSLIYTGSLSYGIYIVHYPILYSFGHTALFTGSPLTYIIRLAIFLLIVWAGSFILEKKFQPWIKKISDPFLS